MAENIMESIGQGMLAPPRSPTRALESLNPDIKPTPAYEMVLEAYKGLVALSPHSAKAEEVMLVVQRGEIITHVYRRHAPEFNPNVRHEDDHENYEHRAHGAAAVIQAHFLSAATWLRRLTEHIELDACPPKSFENAQRDIWFLSLETDSIDHTIHSIRLESQKLLVALTLLERDEAGMQRDVWSPYRDFVTQFWDCDKQNLSMSELASVVDAVLRLEGEFRILSSISKQPEHRPVWLTEVESALVEAGTWCMRGRSEPCAALTKLVDAHRIALLATDHADRLIYGAPNRFNRWVAGRKPIGRTLAYTLDEISQVASAAAVHRLAKSRTPKRAVLEVIDIRRLNRERVLEIANCKFASEPLRDEAKLVLGSNLRASNRPNAPSSVLNVCENDLKYLPLWRLEELVFVITSQKSLKNNQKSQRIDDSMLGALMAEIKNLEAKVANGGLSPKDLREIMDSNLCRSEIRKAARRALESIKPNSWSGPDVGVLWVDVHKSDVPPWRLAKQSLSSLRSFGVDEVEAKVEVACDKSSNIWTYTIFPKTDSDKKNADLYKQRGFPLTGRLSQPALVNVANRKTLKIPEYAHVYAWAFPAFPPFADVPDYWIPKSFDFFLLYGGYVYLKKLSSGTLSYSHPPPEGVGDDVVDHLASTAIKVTSLKPGAALQFASPQPLNPDHTRRFVEQGAFRPITLAVLRQLGARRFAWLSQDEVAKMDLTAPFGGFAYIYGEEPDGSPDDPRNNLFALLGPLAKLSDKSTSALSRLGDEPAQSFFGQSVREIANSVIGESNRQMSGSFQAIAG